ncbi:mitochondrial ornithine transporter 1 [[Candida] jaroonii]|uniref:Mitochondrial ornithine transporter 1 n=1 Tax=[Candida] jaroonii TaxID=467808 RepID=A0ACA9Y269_9ASCO|nr:mitochondrial ornithine transporter 1 [[Candida] jaroonii]
MKQDEVNPVKDMIFGAISGVIGKTIEFPFDTIKVRLQSSLVPISTFQMIKATYNEGIIKGFYQGLKAPLIGACLENAILFSSYNSCLEMFKTVDRDIGLRHKALSGAFAGFSVSFILTPIELVKCQLQVSNLATPGSVKKVGESATTSTKNIYSSMIWKIYQKDGVSGFWKGLSPTLLRETIGTMIWFTTYEVLSEYLDKKRPSELNSLVSGALAGLTFNLSMFPVDTIKSNIQTNDILDHGTTNSFEIARKIGIRGLYSGLTITLIRSLPANAMIFYSYELLKKNL